MALNVGELVANLKLDDSQYNQKIDNAEGRFSRFGSMLGAVVKTVGAAGAGAVLAAGAVGLSTSAQMEQAEIGFTTMLGSGEKAKAFLGDLSAFAAKTPFAFPELQTAASSLVSSGVEASKVIPIMTSLGNATSGMGTGSEGVKRATVALQQMNAAGKITGEDLNQLRDAGIPVYDLLAAATGKSKEAVAELAQKGKLGKKELGELMTALESGKGLERFTGLMEKQSASLTGQWSTLKDTFSMGMASAIEPLIPLIKTGLGGATTFLAEQLPKVATGIAGLIAGVQGKGPIDGFAGALNTAGLGVRALVLAFQDGDVTSNGFVGQMEKAGVAVRQVWDAVSSGDMGKLQSGMAGAGDSTGPLVSALGSLRDLLPDIGTLVSAAASVVGFLADNSDTLVTLLPFLVAGFVAYKVAMAAGNVAALASVPITAAQAASNFALASAIRASGAAATTSAVQQVAAGQVTHVSMLKTGALALLTGAQVVAGWVMSAAAAMASAASIALAWVISLGPIALVILAIGAVVAIITLLWQKSETFRDIVTGAFDMVKQGVGNAVGFMIEGFRGLLGVWLAVAGGILEGAAKALGWIPGLGDKLQAANQAFDAMKNGILATLDQAANAAYGMGEKTGTGVAAGVQATGPMVRRSGRGLIDDAAGGISAGAGVAYEAGVSVGENAGQGLVNGISRKTQLVRAAAQDLAREAGRAMATGLQERSPSRVTYRIGEFAGMGLEQGLLSRLGSVGAASTQVARAAGDMAVTVGVPGVNLGGQVRGGDGAAAPLANTQSASGPVELGPDTIAALVRGFHGGVGAALDDVALGASVGLSG